MIPRNLQNVSKTASHSHKYALFHAHKRKIINNNTLHSNTLSMSYNPSSTPSSYALTNNSNSSITYNQKYCFSKTKKTHPTDTSDLTQSIPPNLNLSPKEQENIGNIFQNLSKTGQTNFVQFISQKLHNSTRQSLQKSSIDLLIQNEKVIKNMTDKSAKTYLRLTFIESTPTQSIQAATNEYELLFDTPANKQKNELLHGLHSAATSIQSMDVNNVYHGWLSTSNNIKTTGTKPPSLARSFVDELKIKQQSVIIAAVDKSLEKQLKTLKDVVIYALALDAEYGGFHETPKWAMTDDIVESKVIAKSTEMSSEMSWEDEDDILLEKEEDDLLPQVERIQRKMGEKAQKQEYRAKHLQKWQDGLQGREKIVEDEKTYITQKDSDIHNKEQTMFTKEQQLLTMRQDLKWKGLQNKRNISEIEQETQSLFIMEQKLNQQQMQQNNIALELETRKQSIEEREKALNDESEAMLERETDIKERGNILNAQSIKLRQDNDEYVRDKQALAETKNEIENTEKVVANWKTEIENEREILNKDKSEWNDKVEEFKQREHGLRENELKYNNDMNAMNEQKEGIAKSAKNTRKREEKSKRKSSELDAKEKELESREIQLSEKESNLQRERRILEEKQKEFNQLRDDLKANELLYNTQIKKFQEDTVKFERNKKEFDLDEKALKQKQILYEQDIMQLNQQQNELKMQLKDMEAEKLHIHESEQEIQTQQSELNEFRVTLNSDKILLRNGKDLLQKQELELKGQKKAIDSKEKKIDKRFVELNVERNDYLNDKVKTKQLQSELATKEKEINSKTKANQRKEKDMDRKYNEMKNEEEAVMKKIEPIKEKEKLLNEREEILEKKEGINMEQEQDIKTKKLQIIETQKKLNVESDGLKNEQCRLDSLDKQLQNRQNKISEHDRRVMRNIDEFNKEKYEISKLEKSLSSKANEVSEREQKSKIQQQNIDKTQIKINQQTQDMLEKKKELTTLRNDFDARQKVLEVQEKEFKHKSEILQSEQMKLDKLNTEYMAKKKQFDEEKIKIASEKSVIAAEKDYFKQQNQALSSQKKSLDSDKEKIHSNGLLLASRTQQLHIESERLKSDQLKLEQINTDLQSAQKKHEQENERLTTNKQELQNEQHRLDALQQTLSNKTRTLELTALRLTEQELALQKVATSLEKQKMEFEADKNAHVPVEKVHELNTKEAILTQQAQTLKVERDSQKERESLLEISKQQILSNQQDIIQKEQRLRAEELKLNTALKQAEDISNHLKTKLTTKETALSTQAAAMRDRDLNLSEQEHKLKDKEQELKDAEHKLKDKQYELSNVQRDLDSHRTQIRMEMKQNKTEINEARLQIETEQNKLSEQKQSVQQYIKQQQVAQSENERELSQQISALRGKCDALQQDIYTMEANVSDTNQKLDRLSRDNDGLIQEKQVLQDAIVQREKLEKQIKRPIDGQKQMLRNEQVENEKQRQHIKHLMSAVKRKQNAAKHKENAVESRENNVLEQQRKQQGKERGIELMSYNLQTQLAMTDRAQREAEHVKKMYDEKFVSGLQQDCNEKDLLIGRLEKELRELNMKKMRVPLSSAAGYSAQISKRNVPKLPTYIQPKSIEISDAGMLAVAVGEPDRFQPETLVSVPINSADPICDISKHNQPSNDKIIAESIPINDVIKDMKGVQHPSSAPSIFDKIATGNIESVPLSSVAAISQISQRNVPKLPSYIAPKCIDITGMVSSATIRQPDRFQAETHVPVPINAAQPRSMISKNNQPSHDTVIAESIAINEPYTSKDIIAKHPDPVSSVLSVIVGSVALSTAPPISQISARNMPNVAYIEPKSIAISDVLDTKPSIQEPDRYKPISVAIETAEPVTMISKHNLPKLPGYIQAKTIDINLIKTPTFNDLASPQQRIMDVTDEDKEIPPKQAKKDKSTLTKQKDVDQPRKKYNVYPPKKQAEARIIEAIATETATAKSVELNAVEPISVISRTNQPNPNQIIPESISITPQAISAVHIASQGVVVKPIGASTVALFAAEPISALSRSNQPDIGRVMLQSIPINDAVKDTKAEIKHPIHSDSDSAASILDGIATANIESVPLSRVAAITQISQRNMPKLPSHIPPKSIEISLPQTQKETISEPDRLKAISVPLTAADPISPLSKHNRSELLNKIIPQSIPINVIGMEASDILSVPLSAALPTSTLSRHNVPKLWYNIASCIPVTSIIEATDHLLAHPSQYIHTPTNMDKFKRDLKELRGFDEKESETEPITASFEQTEAKEEVTEEIELGSNINANDLDALFQCTTNKDLLFDDISHIETIFCGLNQELQNCLIECRDYKSMINPLPSIFQSNICDFNVENNDIFTGDVICCLQWKFDNDEYDNLCNNILPNLIDKCNIEIDQNRALMEQYKIAIKDDSKRSTSNRNKLRRKKQEKMNIFDINDKHKNNNGLEFKNNLNAELLALQYVNSEWLLLQSILNEWNTYILSLRDIDSAACNASDSLYLRSFCILPSQTQDLRDKIVSNLSTELKKRKWVTELTNVRDNLDIFYSEMGDVMSWEDKLLIRDLNSYLLNGTNFELNSDNSAFVPLSEGFVRIGYQSQLLIESAQSLLAHIDPFMEQIITKTQNWAVRDNNMYARDRNKNIKNIQLSLENGKDLDLINIDPIKDLKNKTALQRAKIVEKDEKYISLFKDPLIADVNELLLPEKMAKIDQKYIKQLHKFLSSYFLKLYRDKLMLETANSTIIEETAPETWQKHALLEAVFSDEFSKLLQLLSNKSLTKQICNFASYDVYEINKGQHLDSTEQQNKANKMYHELFKPFETFIEYYQSNIVSKFYEIISDFQIQQYLSDNMCETQIALQNKKKKQLWHNMRFTEKLLAPQQFMSDEDSEMPQFTNEEKLATYWSGYLFGVLNNVPIERPIRLPEYYHDICGDENGDNHHLKQHYYVDSYRAPSHEDVANRVSIEDKMNGVDIYRDKYIQRRHQSKRILETKLQFLYHNKLDYMRGAFPLQNFNCLPYAGKKPIKHRVTVRKSTFVQARAQENYETRIYTKIATNYKLTSNRTADMFNARGFDIIYDTVRLM